LPSISVACAERAPAGREFHFLSARSIVMNCGQRAADLPAFVGALAVALLPRGAGASRVGTAGPAATPQAH